MGGLYGFNLDCLNIKNVPFFDSTSLWQTIQLFCRLEILETSLEVEFKNISKITSYLNDSTYVYIIKICLRILLKNVTSFFFQNWCKPSKYFLEQGHRLSILFKTRRLLNQTGFYFFLKIELKNAKGIFLRISEEI